MNVFILEDHPLVMNSLESLLINSFEDVNVTGIGDLCEAIKRIDDIKYTNYDLVIVDLTIKGKKSFGFLQKSINRNKKTKHLIFTSSIRKDYYEEAFSYDINGYIVKESMPEDVIYAIRSVMKGNIFIDPIFNEIEANRKKESKTENLTDREKELLRLIGKGYSNKQIADELFISVNTVKKHVTNILAKMDFEERTQAVLYCQQNYV